MTDSKADETTQTTDMFETTSETLNWRDLVAKSRLDQAIMQYRLSDEQDESVPYALKTLAGMLESLRAKSWAKASRMIESLDERPDILNWNDLTSQLDQLKRAGEAIDKREPEEAQQLLQTITFPLLLPEAETLRGTAHVFVNDLDKAKHAFENAISQDPKHYRALTNLGNLALESGQTDEAIVLYERALKLNDGFTNALHNLGVAYRKKGQISKSVRQLRKAQNAGQQKLREEARESLKSGMSPQLRKYLKWAVYAVIAITIYAILNARGII